MHDVFWYHEPNWLEVTIAVPIFVGLVCYYIEGPHSERHHMMESSYAHPERAYGVRGISTTSNMVLTVMVPIRCDMISLDIHEYLIVYDKPQIITMQSTIYVLPLQTVTV